MTAVDSMRPAIATVRAVRRETADVVTIRLDHGDRSDAFEPGQFHMLYAFGAGEVPISVSGRPARGGGVEHTIRAVGATTRALCRLRRGGTVGVRGPFGTAWPVEEARGRDVVLVAGGIGLAPLRPVIQRIIAERELYGRVTVLYGARTPDDILFEADLARWRGRFDLQVGVTVDHADASWRGHVGVVTTLLTDVDLDPDACLAILCGPEVMMRFTAAELEARGIPRREIWVSLERNMHCGVGLCGHCQMGPELVCRRGPVYRLDHVGRLLGVREV